jgi:hypothetical protein
MRSQISAYLGHLLNQILLVSIIGLTDGMIIPGAEEKRPYWDVFDTLNIVNLVGCI